MPADHHHGNHEYAQVAVLSQVVEHVASNIDELEWKTSYNNHELRALKREVDELRTRCGKTQEVIEAFMASFCYEEPPVIGEF